MSPVKKVLLFGTGSGGELSYYSIRDRFDVIGFCDNDKEKQSKTFLGKKVYSPDVLSSLPFDFIYICSVTYRNQIFNQLKLNFGIDTLKIKFIDDSIMKNRKTQFMEKRSFCEMLFLRISDSQFKEYCDNFDEHRFGTLTIKPLDKISWRFRNILKKAGLFHCSWLAKPHSVHLSTWMNLVPDLEWLYRRLADEESRKLLVEIIAYRIMGHKAVKLPLAYTDYKERKSELNKLQDKTKSIEINFLGKKRQRYFFNYNSIGYPVSGFLGNPYTQFILEQYAYHDGDVVASPGDVVIDGGGCFGETSLYFSCKVGISGQVHSFEFVPSNVKVFKKNLEFNPEISSCVHLVDKALWNRTGESLFINDRGPGTKVSSQKMPGFDNSTETISIDDYVHMKTLSSVGFIKLDIEGAEEQALAGAEKTIRTMKPKMAVCLYHSPQDFIRIPQLLDKYCPDYKFYLKHNTIHAEETVLFAKV